MELITVTGYKGGVTSALQRFISHFSKRPRQSLMIDGDPNRAAIAWSERGDLPFDVVDERKAMKIISDYDYAVIDTPARPDSSDLKELAEGCDLLILPTLPDVVSLDPMLQTAADLQGASYRALIAIVPPRPIRMVR